LTFEEICEISEYTGISGVFARTTPAIYDDMLIFGDQGGRIGAGARVMAVDKNTGELIGITQVDAGFPFSIVTQSATVFDDLVYVGVSSFEEFFAAVIPDYQCCAFEGSMLALDVATGDVVWQTSMWAGLETLRRFQTRPLCSLTGESFRARA
jgi:polyvinyl alcohol dehydrogenase (cytochrome)